MSSFKGHLSENEDDPAIPESSGSEFDIEAEKKQRRTSQRLSKKPRISIVESADESSDDSIVEVKRKNARNGVKKPVVKKVVTPKETVVKVEEIQPQVKRVIPMDPNKLISNISYSPGTFVIAKKDAQSGDMSNPPCIWKIDGKALLQKYEAYEHEGKIRHRNTSIYTGWSALDKDTYSPIKVKVCYHSGTKMEVEINWEDLKIIDLDSD